LMVSPVYLLKLLPLLLHATHFECLLGVIGSASQSCSFLVHVAAVIFPTSVRSQYA
jgi:hypothetical protein